jgi:hypothetical protein
MINIKNNIEVLLQIIIIDTLFFFIIDFKKFTNINIFTGNKVIFLIIIFIIILLLFQFLNFKKNKQIIILNWINGNSLYEQLFLKLIQIFFATIIALFLNIILEIIFQTYFLNNYQLFITFVLINFSSIIFFNYFLYKGIKQ